MKYFSKKNPKSEFTYFELAKISYSRVLFSSVILMDINPEEITKYVSVTRGYHLRLHVSCDVDLAYTLLDSMFNKFIVSTENGNHLHVAFCIESTDDRLKNKMDLLRKQVKESFAQYANVDTKGNRFYSIAQQRSKRLVSYVLKDGHYRYKGYSDETIEQYKIKSFKKGSFQKQLNLLREKYLDQDADSTYDISHFAADIIRLKSEYSQSINLAQIKAYCRSIYYKKNPTLIYDQIKEYFSDIDDPRFF